MDEAEKLMSGYRSQIARKTLFILVGIFILLILMILSCALGTGYGFTQTYQIIVDRLAGVSYPPGSSDWWADHYICENVLPGVIISVVAGAGLAVGGTVMQSMMSNPLADPYTTGISSGACLGAVSALIMGFTFTSVTGSMGIVTNAFIGAVIPAIIVIMLTRYVGNSPSTMILIGTAISYFFNAIVTLIMMTSSAESLESAFLWQIGSVTGMGWEDVPLMAIITMVSVITVEAVAGKLNLLMMGEGSAKSMGLDVQGFRTLCLILISVLIASIISFTGIIGFVGLIAPHIARFVIGGDNRFVTPASIVVGSLTLCLADVVSRSLLDFGNIPIGVVMSFIGAPIFLYLVVRSKSDREVF